MAAVLVALNAVFQAAGAVTTTGNPTDGGSVSPTGSLAYPIGTQVQFTASPSANYTFTSWTVNGADAGRAAPVLAAYERANIDERTRLLPLLGRLGGAHALFQTNYSAGPGWDYDVSADGKNAARVQVKLGRASVNTIEVREGLKVGDRIILSDMSAWDNYERIRLN